MADQLGIDRSRLPIADPSFAGRRGRTLADSTPDWGLVGDVNPPEGAPNILLVLIDDAGFGQPSTFGGLIPTPNLTRMAEAGLRYNGMHVAALCSPTRAALLTGRNHHRVGFGSTGELSGPFPGYASVVPRDCAPFPKVLQMNGYSTAAFGKWHMTPSHVQGPSGPFDRWPSGWGFDYFWGFLAGESGQYDPMIYENDSVDQVYGGPADRTFYLPDAMADKTIEWLHGVTAHNDTKPWFVYFSTCCAHAPHHVTEEWSARYRGKFDAGWDVYRDEVFARQKALGVIPEDAVLTPRDEAFPAWDSLSAEERKLYARQMEVYAGYQENADHNVGRVLDELQRMGKLDNTLVLYIWGDNGASMEGTLTGSFNELTMFNGIPLTAEQQLALVNASGGIDVWGGPSTAPHCSAAWAWAGNTPFSCTTRTASWESKPTPHQSDSTLPTGNVRLRLDFEADAPVMAPAGTVTLFANDERLGGGRMDHTVPVFFTGTPVSTSAGTTARSSTPATRSRHPLPSPARSIRSPTTSDPRPKPTTRRSTGHRRQAPRRATPSPDPTTVEDRAVRGI